MSYQVTGGVSFGGSDSSWLVNDFIPPMGQDRPLPTWAECMAKARSMPVIGDVDKFEPPKVKLQAPAPAGPVLAAASGQPEGGLFEALARGVRNFFGGD